MVFVRSRKFCCCLPVRFGVFVMTLTGALCGGAVAIALWIRIAKNGTFQTAPTRDEIIAAVNAAAWTLLAIVSLFGLIGAIAKRARLVSLYATLLYINLALSIATGVFYLFILFKSDTKRRVVEKCVDGDRSSVKRDGCNTAYDVYRIVLIPIYCFVWFFLLYGCLIVSNYIGQLREERALKMPYLNASAKTSSTYPGFSSLQSFPMATTSSGYKPLHNCHEAQPYHEAQPLAAHDHNEYPYNAPDYSFVNK
ncbi:uncharacterized protein FOMMEDRAFT_164747 [Fomitiporia mediterranea MF3/22]|uniref:uncharacterized protein n=1 Tax=Fomitiporia mediterranea (strain MF3/22) TaxID=694068 RepID=UPI0004409207|nr:uncharacterized protein FOMMEDRAFT_164747 [Fomitiporia mediterranea MF3/22]EJD07929.1 hypothetical protein FOMMEDRAFT_164747 [Fomitiporia mediterranea MF3/22]